MKQRSAVRAWEEELILPTYLPAAPDKSPMFLEKRVYQGSSGKVYPLPFTDRIAEHPLDRKWKAVWIENEFLRAMVLPELGGRIHILQDKTNGYDLIYNQRVIKPALVGLAGPWISGGIEFNWPQHHRPATFLPADWKIEKHADGSATIWCSDHDPMTRMKGMHGVCLHPGRAYLEVKVRAYNRTPFTQTFLWWANVATRVHEAYQSFFPPDVYYVADHARRSMSEYPLARNFYYGVNYGGRGRDGIPREEMPGQFIPPVRGSGRRPATLNYLPNDLSFYANIPVPTSYMCMGSLENFFGGYDHKVQAGIIHVANHHISPGKKQWTWGNNDFGYAWDRNLTDPDAQGEFGPYIEIMAGVYTDNQPDFSFLQPGETKTWSQYWYPIQQIGPAQQANLDAAISLRRENSSRISIGISVTRPFKQAKITVVNSAGKNIARLTRDLAPGKPLLAKIKLPSGVSEMELRLRVADRDGSEIISFQPKPRPQAEVPPPATEPASPADLTSADELFITGLHLEQYRHATRSPLLYWREALRRDPFDSRCNDAVGLWHLKRGEFGLAEKFFRRAIERLIRRNSNPYDGEAYYNLGLTLRYLSRDDEAYSAFYKAVWNQAWMSAGYHALAEIDCTRKDWATALDHLERSLQFNTENLRARNLQVMVLRKLNRRGEATAKLQETLARDPLDGWARFLHGEPVSSDLQTALDIAHDFARAGFFAEAIRLLCNKVGQEAQKCLADFTHGTTDLPTQSLGAEPLVQYTLCWLLEKTGAKVSAAQWHAVSVFPADYCFPARLEEIAILETAMRANPRDAKAPYYLGNLFYDRRRHQEAIRLWEKSALLDGNFSIVWRNLGLGYFNIRKNASMARTVYDKAFRVNPSDARLLYERDQLWKRAGESPARRLRELEKFSRLVHQRDDLTVELCSLLNQTGRHADAASILEQRQFQTWEGGEGGPLGQHVRAQLALGRAALAQNDAAQAAGHFQKALATPPNLGEAKHLLANQSDIHYWAGMACDAFKNKSEARRHWMTAANFKGDFQEMSVRVFSEMTYYSALSWKKLGQTARAKKLFHDLLAYARALEKSEARIDYFATSLPAMLIFEDDIQARQKTTAQLIQAQAQAGLDRPGKARALLKIVLRRDPNHALAADLQNQLGGR